jgi:hypothetical protein
LEGTAWKPCAIEKRRLLNHGPQLRSQFRQGGGIALRAASTPSRRAMNQADPRLGGQVRASRNAVQSFIERTLAAGLAIETRQPVFLTRLRMLKAISESIVEAFEGQDGDVHGVLARMERL